MTLNITAAADAVEIRAITNTEIEAVAGAARPSEFRFAGYTFQANDRGCWAVWGQDKSNGPLISGGPADAC